jgi:hypothetical protein
LVLAALFAAALIPAGTAGAQRSHSIPQRIARTTTPDLYITINVTLSDSKITLSRYSAPRGAEVRFIVRNVGSTVHSFQIGVAKPGVGQLGFSLLGIKPRQEQIHLLFLDYRQTIPFFAPTGSNRSAPGMKGKFAIGPCTPAEVRAGLNGC